MINNTNATDTLFDVFFEQKYNEATNSDALLAKGVTRNEMKNGFILCKADNLLTAETMGSENNATSVVPHKSMNPDLHKVNTF